MVVCSLKARSRIKVNSIESNRVTVARSRRPRRAPREGNLEINL